MKTKILPVLLFATVALLWQGCIAFPPLIQVEHKDGGGNNDAVMRKLDSIERRLDNLEKRPMNPPPQ